jgi:carbonic anhydrase/acetyltransferase-like protein (isoleucine patch superfamily)
MSIGRDPELNPGHVPRCLNGSMTLYALDEERPQIHPEAYVHPKAILIGEVRVGPSASIWPGAIIRADNGPIVIGARTSIQDGAVIHTQLIKQTRIGADCVVGHLAHLEGCLLEDLVLVGSGAVVLEGVTCRSGSLVGAGAVVAPGTEVPAGAMALGVPARIRPGAVNRDSVKVNAEAYSSRHLPQHRDGSHEVSLAECLET